MKNTFAPIFTKMLDSSVWEEPLHVRVLWVAMLALKDADHVVRFNDYQLHRRANLTVELTMEALEILSAPDQRRADQEFDGRRIRKVDDGWLILNGQLYEDEMRRLSRNVYQARKQREYRQRKKGQPLPGEALAAKAVDQNHEDSIITAALPEPKKMTLEQILENGFDEEGLP